MLQMKNDIPILLSTHLNEIKKINDSLSIQGVLIKDIPITKIFDEHTTIFIVEKAVNKMFNLKYYIDHLFSWLLENILEFEMRFKKFFCTVKTTKTKNYENAITTKDAFQQHSLVDCELIIFHLNDVVLEAYAKTTTYKIYFTILSENTKV